VNIHDLEALVEHIRQGQFPLRRIVSTLLATGKGRTEEAWSIERPPTAWSHIPLIQRHWNCVVTGNAYTGYYEYVLTKYLSDRSSLVALSLACGSGGSELAWAQLGKFARIDAYDLSKERIEYAKRRAREAHCDHILNYEVADVYDLKVIDDHYDVVLAENALHHFTPLDKLLYKIHRCLKPDGYLIVKDFVGPTRFQWTDKQLDIVNGLLAVIPRRYRIRWGSGTVKSRVFRPSILSMILGDPSEAVESSRIMPLLRKAFEIVEVKEYGGTVLHLLFGDIAHNFISEDEETIRILKLCIEVEDLLLGAGELPSDFALAICRKRVPK
jgi:SAM-dependent methyltransferase